MPRSKRALITRRRPENPGPVRCQWEQRTMFGSRVAERRQVLRPTCCDRGPKRRQGRCFVKSSWQQLHDEGHRRWTDFVPDSVGGLRDVDRQRFTGFRPCSTIRSTRSLLHNRLRQLCQTKPVDGLATIRPIAMPPVLDDALCFRRYLERMNFSASNRSVPFRLSRRERFRGRWERTEENSSTGRGRPIGGERRRETTSPEVR